MIQHSMEFPETEVYSDAVRKEGEWFVFGLKLVEDTLGNRKRADEGCAACCYQSESYVLTKGKNGAPIVAACTGFEEGISSGSHGTVEFFEAGLSVRTPEDHELKLPIQKKAPPCRTKFSLQLGSTR